MSSATGEGRLPSAAELVDKLAGEVDEAVIEAVALREAAAAAQAARKRMVDLGRAIVLAASLYDGSDDPSAQADLYSETYRTGRTDVDPVTTQLVRVGAGHRVTLLGPNGESLSMQQATDRDAVGVVQIREVHTQYVGNTQVGEPIVGAPITIRDTQSPFVGVPELDPKDRADQQSAVDRYVFVSDEAQVAFSGVLPRLLKAISYPDERQVTPDEVLDWAGWSEPAAAPDA